MDVVFQVLKLLGSLGLFLYGMVLMSEGIQKFAGDKMNSILSAISSSSFKRVLTGLFITSLIQSSGVTTVMVVSFVNAGLISLTQSIGVIMGANIGTSVTAWIVTLLGFTFDLTTFSIPLVGLGFVLLMFKTRKLKSSGEILVGFSLLFLGLIFMKESVPDLQSAPVVLEFFRQLTNYGFLSVLIFAATGTLLTLILNSASATIVLTLIICNYGWLPFEYAIAMVMGENIATTISANFASSSANVSAKRAALGHSFFNLFGIIWVLILFHPILQSVSKVVIVLSGTDPFNSTAAALLGICTFHTLFNLANTLILVWFTPQIAKIVTYLIKQPKTEEVMSLKLVHGGLLYKSELSISQVNQEIVNFSKLTRKQFEYARLAVKECEKDDFETFFHKLKNFEQITDKIEVDISNYLTKIAENTLSEVNGKRLQAMYKIISEIENIGDSGFCIARTLQRKKEHNVNFDSDMFNNLDKMFMLLEKAFDNMILNLDHGLRRISNITDAENSETDINEYRNKLKDEHLFNPGNNANSYHAGAYYMDLIAECERTGDYIINISEAIIEIQ